MSKAVQFAFALGLCGILFGLCACKNENPDIDERFIAAYVDMRVAEQMYGVTSPMTRLYRKATLKKYGYTRESFLAETDKILMNSDYWKPFQNRVVARLDSVLDPESFIKKKEEEAAKAKAKKEKVAPKPGEVK